ncbi:MULTISPECIES: hypothetical protein [unclassified Bradyrhizobium]|uniref:hypothetical protein n=1 Tax=unclassified Bradyrhizobium TaxID=2631580 RepID=UPI0028ED5A68|nr:MULTISPECIES: hypothetical protein [unclassified Bradyrhizobium]
MPDKRVSFCIEANAAKRELFFVLESEKTGNLKLLFRRSLFHNPDNKNDPLAGKLIDEQRYSLHTSPNSTHGLNTFHHTYRVGEHLRHGYSFTKAIKSKTGFVPLFSRRCPNLAQQHYIPGFKKSTIEVGLGKYDPTRFMLLYSVFVGPPTREFLLFCSHKVCAVQYQFAQFSLVVLWSFLSLPSSENGWKLHAEIPHPDTIAEHPELSSTALSCQEADCVKYHESKVSYLRHQFLCWIESAETRNCSAILGQHIRYGLPETPEYQDHLRRFGISRLFPTPTYPVEEGSFSLEDGYVIFAG